MESSKSIFDDLIYLYTVKITLLRNEKFEKLRFFLIFKRFQLFLKILLTLYARAESTIRDDFPYVR